MTMKHRSLNQLLCAATVNGRFRETLLSDPARAIASGYFDHSFSLTPEERDLVIGIQARRLEDFAAQVYHWISGNGHGHNGNGLNGHARNGYGVEDHVHNGHGLNGHAHNGNGHNGNGHNGNGHNGNGYNGHAYNGTGHSHDLIGSTERLVDLYRAPVPVHA